MHTFMEWYHQYSHLVLFLGLLLEYVFLPFPGEFVMGYSGYMAFLGEMNYLVCLLLAFSGTAIGSTITYFVGYKLGLPFFDKFGRKVFITPEKILATSKWIAKYGGNRAFSIAYFIPGVRHFTGYFAGVVRIPFRAYATYAYAGSFIWVFLYVSLGRLLGSRWEAWSHKITNFILYLIIGAGVLLGIFLLVRWILSKKKAAKELEQQQSQIENAVQVENN